MNTHVLTNAKYSKNIDENTKTNLKKLENLTNTNTIKKKMTSTEMAKLFGLNENTMNDLYTYYLSVSQIDTKMSISEFSNFVLTNVMKNQKYASLFNESTVKNINMLSTFSNTKTITKNMNSKELANLLGIDENSVKQLLLLKYKNSQSNTKLSISEFVNNVLYLKANTPYLDNIDEATLKSLNTLKLAIDNGTIKDTNKYTSTELSKVLGIDKNKTNELYVLIDFSKGNTNNWKMTPNAFVKFILQNSNNENINKSMNQNTLGQLNLLSNIMDSTLNKTTYTYKQMSEFIGIDSNTTKNIYTLYVSSKNTTKLTPQEFVNFVLANKNTPTLSSNLNSSTVKELTLVQSAMNGALNNKKYTSTELGNLLGINKNSLDLLYGLYYSKYVDTNQTISLKHFVEFILNDVMNNSEYSSNFDNDSKSKLTTINGVMNATLNNTKYTKEELFAILSEFTNDLDKNTIDLLYVYYGSTTEYNETWTLTVENFVNFLNDDILNDSRFNDFIKDDIRQNITDAKTTVNDAKELLIGNGYSRIVINTNFVMESEDTFKFIQDLKDTISSDVDQFYIIGDSPMAYEMSKTFQAELDFITVLTMIAIFIVVAITFRSIIVPIILVLLIQCAVYMTMGFLSFSGEGVYFISLLIVQSILMGATIDYAILYSSYYIEHRKTMSVKESIINSYNKSIHTILTSASILIIVTLIVGNFASAIAAKICKTISEGTLCSALLILLLLPAILGLFDKFIMKRQK